MTAPERLYGVPGTEHMHDDPAGVYESDIEEWASIAEPQTIEEWTVKPVIDTVTSADCILDDIAERMGDEMDENGHDELHKVIRHPEVVEAAEALRQAIASKVHYWWVDRLVATHTVTWDEKDQPLLDGEPMYHKAPA